MGSLRCVRFDRKERKVSVERLFELMAPSVWRKTFNHGKEPFSSTSDVESLQEGGSKARYFSATEEGPRSGQTVIEGIVQGGPLPSGISGVEAKKSSAKSVSVEACKIAQAKVPKLVPSPSRTSQKFQHVGWFEAALAFRPEARRRCRAKVALQQARMRVRVRSVGEGHDLYTQLVAQRKKQVARAQEQVREARVVQVDMEEKLANGLRDSEPFRAEASKHPRPCLEPSTTRQGMELDPNEESIRLKAQEADLQS